MGIEHPRCKCGKEYADIRKFKWGLSLLRNRVEFSVFVCDLCRCYWYDDSIPLKAKQCAFDAFDWFPEGHRLPPPSAIREYRRLHPESYPDIDLEKYERGEISNRHPLYYEYYAEHAREEVSARNAEIEEFQRKLAAAGAEIAKAQEVISSLSLKRLGYMRAMEQLARKFIREESA